MPGRGVVAVEQTRLAEFLTFASSYLVLTSSTVLAVLDLKTSYMAGYAVLGATALSTAAILAL